MNEVKNIKMNTLDMILIRRSKTKYSVTFLKKGKGVEKKGKKVIK